MNRVSCGASAFFKSKRPRNVRWSVRTNIQIPPGVIAHYNDSFGNTIIKIIYNRPPRLNCNCCSIIYYVHKFNLNFIIFNEKQHYVTNKHPGFCLLFYPNTKYNMLFRDIAKVIGNILQ